MSELLMNWVVAISVAMLSLLGFTVDGEQVFEAEPSVGQTATTEVAEPLVVEGPSEYQYFSGHYGSPEDATALAQREGCFEDEVLIVVIAEVQPDNGVPPGVDWAPKGDLTGTLFCVPADNLASR